MRHAYLIIAHDNFCLLKQLIKLLDDKNNDIYVHIDKKSKAFRKEDYHGITTYSSVYYFQEYKVYWGGYSQVQVELYLGEQAHKNGYDYYHYISGVDLPLKTNREIQTFFEKNRGYEFVDFDDNNLQKNPEISRRTRLYHYLQNYRRRYKNKIFNNFFTFCERVLLLVQIIIGINRVKHLDWTIKYGSNWVSITDNLLTAILNQKNKIYEIFHCTNSSDELFIQTIAYNCGFKDKIYQSEHNLTSNMRFIDWNRGKNGNPYTFKIDDLELLRSSDALFARKFSETIDKEVINEIIKIIADRNRVLDTE